MTPAMSHFPCFRSQLRRQRGVASLVVVMVLFLIVAMVAAYTNRNLIFEQRTSVNQYRSTQALEAADAGLEWAKAMLNQGRITASCLPSTPSTLPPDTTFRQRYLSVDSAGIISPVPNSTPSVGALTASCVRNGTGWDCDCPSTGTPALTTTSTDISPAFRVRFVGGIAQPGLVRIESNGCTRLDPACLSFTGQGVGSEGRVTVTELVGFVPALASTPVAALTAGGNINIGSAAMPLYNGDLASGGWTIQARGTVSAPNAVLSSLPGTPGSASIIDNDTSLPSIADRMFTGTFNMWPATYRDQPAAIVLDASHAGCSGSGCNAAAVRDAQAMNPGRVIWVVGNLTIDSSGDIGSATEPAMIVVTGDLTFTTAATIYGAVYVRTVTWASGGAGQIQGALIAEKDVSGGMTTTVVYNAAVLKLLRTSTCSVVGVPGGWKDYCTGNITPTACN
jgi:Tfp pilus assembly protein PilX